MKIACNISDNASLITALVNLATPHHQGGAIVGRLTGADLREAFAARLDPSTRAALNTDPSAGAALTELAAELRRALLATDPSRKARQLNTMIHKYGARPYLKEDGPFQISFQGSGGAVHTLAGSFATALALIMDGYGPDRFGECQAHNCEAVYIDLTRNNSRRYCGTPCTARAKTAAYRTRHQPH